MTENPNTPSPLEKYEKRLRHAVEFREGALTMTRARLGMLGCADAETRPLVHVIGFPPNSLLPVDTTTQSLGEEDVPEFSQLRTRGEQNE